MVNFNLTANHKLIKWPKYLIDCFQRKAALEEIECLMDNLRSQQQLACAKEKTLIIALLSKADQLKLQLSWESKCELNQEATRLINTINKRQAINAGKLTWEVQSASAPQLKMRCSVHLCD